MNDKSSFKFKTFDETEGRDNKRFLFKYIKFGNMWKEIFAWSFEEAAEKVAERINENCNKDHPILKGKVIEIIAIADSDWNIKYFEVFVKVDYYTFQVDSDGDKDSLTKF